MERDSRRLATPMLAATAGLPTSQQRQTVSPCSVQPVTQCLGNRSVDTKVCCCLPSCLQPSLVPKAMAHELQDHLLGQQSVSECSSRARQHQVRLCSRALRCACCRAHYMQA